MVSLYNRVLNSPHRSAKEHGVVTSAVIDRETRTKIHQAVRRIFSSRLDTTTGDDGAMIISAATPIGAGRSGWNTRNPMGRGGRGTGRGGGNDGRIDGARRPQQNGKPGWQDLGGEYLHFSLLKENKDTMEVISYLARSLKTKPQSFQFAGTKDRRGVTVQRVSVYRVLADRMVAAGRTLRNAKVGNYAYQPSGLQLGELTGNEFTVTLRDCQFELGAELEGREQSKQASEIVGTAIKNLNESGFINYYGLQRFGTFSTRTDDVGIKMLQGNFEAAVEAILDYSPTSLAAAQDPMSGNDRVSRDDKARAHAIHTFQTTGRSHPAVDEMPKKFSAETNIIRFLGNPDNKNNYLGSLQMISRNLRLMYVHAYQSLVWNVAASERWKRFGDQVIEGDLVLVDEHKDKVEGATKPAEEVDADGEAVVQPDVHDRAATTDEFFTRARALTKEEADSGKYTIFEIVLPTPGYDILYPANEIAAFYKDFMASPRGGGLDPHDMRRPWRDVSLSGSYRKLLARPGKDISYEIKAYINEDEQFVQTDLDRLGRNANGQESNKVDAPPPPDDQPQATVEEATAPKKLAVVLKLQLGSSQYATMALRELMKSGGVRTFKMDYGGGR
jgi:tRNA pseudouridine13 synthase